MTRKVFTIVAAGVVVIGLLSWGVGYAYRHRSPEHRVAWIAKRLNLDEQQAEKLKAIHKTIQHAREEFHKDRADLFDEIAAQVKSERLDETKVLQLFEQRHAVMQQVAPQVIAKVAELHASLTAEQKAEVIEHLEWFRHRMH
jgi:Spy/CpxP family protein refolding chaperone